jgi:hypothetical protein
VALVIIWQIFMMVYIVFLFSLWILAPLTIAVANAALWRPSYTNPYG